MSKLTLNTNDLLQANNIPVTIKSKLLISPGTWNDIQYSAEELEKAYFNTNWSDKSNYSLYLDHKDTKNEGVGNWIGYVKNINLKNKGVLTGDLEVWNPLMALYLTQAEAKFGISATLKGTENKQEGKLQNFRFESFSIVTDPACKEAYINLSQNKLKGGKMAEEIETKVTTLAEEIEEENKKKKEDEDEEESEIEDEELQVEELKKAKKYPYKEKEQAKKKKYPDEEKCAKKKKYPYPVEEEEMSEDELFEITSNSEWTDFVKKMKSKDPEMSFKEIAKAFKSRSKEMEELEQLSDSDLVTRIQLLTNILRKRSIKLEAEKLETPEQKVDKLEKTIKELQSKFNEPDRKTLNVSPGSQPVISSDPIKAMAEFISGGGQGSFGL